VITSGVRLFRYEGPDPFSGSGIQPIGMSGILLEQAMYALIAEADIYNEQLGANRLFTRYTNKEAGLSTTFEPTVNGSGLTIGGSGEVHFTNYITDLRTKFSGLFDLIMTDSPYPSRQILLEYFQKHTGNNPSGSVGNWIHCAAELGSSGSLYDIDLREVMYQPYIRVSKFRKSETSGVQLPLCPVGPMFCTRTGSLVKVTNRDLGNAAQIDEHTLFAYYTAKTNQLMVEGDIFVKNQTRLYFTWTSGQLHSSEYANCNVVAERVLNSGILRGIFGSGFGLFSLPTISVDTGVYSIQVYNTQPRIDNYFTPVSGVIGIWPPLSGLSTSGYIVARTSGGLDEQFTSGFHIFNTAMWQYSTSGALIQSPINGAYLWYRFADNQEWTTANFGPKRWKDIAVMPALPIVGNNAKLVFLMGVTANLATPPIVDRRFVFSKYEPDSLNYLSCFEQTAQQSLASNPSVSKFFWIYGHNPTSGVNFSNYYCASVVDAAGSGPEIFIMNQALGMEGTWDSDGNAGYPPICMINGHLYGFDPTQTASSGATFVWYHNVYDDPSALFPGGNPGNAFFVDSHSYVYEQRDTVYNNTNGISQMFEPINPDNFSFGGIPYVLDPRGTDLDDADGSVWVKFNAKRKGETLMKPFLGRINEGNIGGVKLIISEFIPLKDGQPNWFGPIT